MREKDIQTVLNLLDSTQSNMAHKDKDVIIKATIVFIRNRNFELYDETEKE